MRFIYAIIRFIGGPQLDLFLLEGIESPREETTGTGCNSSRRNTSDRELESSTSTLHNSLQMAYSRIKDLTHTYKGQQYTFVGQLEVWLKELECPICYSIVSKPLQINCGHLFCTGCYNKLRDRTCPVCKQGCTTTVDSYNEKRVRTLKVRCLNHRYGCKWVGDLGDELQHRNTRGSCQFEETACPYGCGKTIWRTTQSDHLNVCPRQPHKCTYCNKVGPYQDIERGHRKKCLRYPVKCPNGCDERIPREETASYILKKEVSTMEAKLQVEKQRTNELEKDAKAKGECIRQLERDVKAKTERVHGLERDTGAKTQHIRGLERDKEVMSTKVHHLTRETQAKTGQIQDLQRETAVMRRQTSDLERSTKAKEQCKHNLERAVKDMTERIHVLQGDNAAKEECIHDLELDTEDKEERMRNLEGEIRAMTECIGDLERNTKDMTEQLHQLQKESEVKTECIRENERATKAKEHQINHLERVTKSKTQHITQLRAENSERQRKLQCEKVGSVCAGYNCTLSSKSPLLHSTFDHTTNCHLYLALVRMTVGYSESNCYE